MRLKGGDPLIFGRATEEIEACRAAGIEVAIVPGISAAQGAAASLGLLADRADERAARPIRHRPWRRRQAAAAISTGRRSPIRSRPPCSTCRARRSPSSSARRWRTASIRRHARRRDRFGDAARAGTMSPARSPTICRPRRDLAGRARRSSSSSAGSRATSRQRPRADLRALRDDRAIAASQAREPADPSRAARGGEHPHHCARSSPRPSDPVMLYSVGKDSAVMLHLARKAFFPAPPPFPLLHVDTTWKFRDMYALRDRAARDAGMELLVYRNPEADAARHQSVRSWQPPHRHVEDRRAAAGARSARLRRGLRRRPARRGEEPRQGARSSASARPQHRWDPKNQRPELWDLYNARKAQGREHPRSSRSPTGPSSTSGNISMPRASRSSRSISPRRARPWSATA